MLKKLVKHGNSSALVLDRSTLALLNMTESSVIKLRIEGETLIIKRADSITPIDHLNLATELSDQISLSIGEKANLEFVKNQKSRFLKKLDKEPELKAQSLCELPTSKLDNQTSQFKEIMDRYKDDFKCLDKEEFKKENDALAEKYQGKIGSEEYENEFLALRMKYAPNLANMDKEIKELGELLNK